MDLIRKLYFIDDSDDDIFLSRLMLERAKVNIDVGYFARFSQFLDELRSNRLSHLDCCLIVVDLNLKITKGTDAIRQLRKEPNAKNLLIGICTGSEDPADIEDATDAGADFYVPKPLNLDTLLTLDGLNVGIHVDRTADGSISIYKQSESWRHQPA